MESLESVVRQSRSLFEMVLADSLGHTRTRGTCLYACTLLLQSIRSFTDTQDAWIAGGGDQDTDVGHGLLGVDGVWHGHYWIEGVSAGQKFLADIAADQFGYPPVILEVMIGERSTPMMERYLADPDYPVVARTAEDAMGLIDAGVAEPAPYAGAGPRMR
jgi:hypothetical protein